MSEYLKAQTINAALMIKTSKLKHKSKKITKLNEELNQIVSKDKEEFDVLYQAIGMFLQNEIENR